MPPTVHFVRHAQGYHNLSLENEQLPDPDLTDLGHQQCRDLHASFPYHSQITALLASPIRRTLNTALESFTPQQSLAPGVDSTPEAIASNPLLPIMAIDTLQEVSNSPCDTGSEPEALEKEFGARVDLRRVRKGWNDKQNPESWAEPRIEKLVARAREARRVIREVAFREGKEDGHVVVVTHGAIVHYLTDEWDGIPEGRATSWNNCEYRSYQFVDPTGQDEEATLEETQECWEKRTGGKNRLNHAEARALRDVMQKRLDPQAQAEIEVQA